MRQLVPKLNSTMMADIERILENKPTRPPMVSTLALRWQSMCPPGSISGGQGGTSNADSPKDVDEVSNTDTDTRENQKLPFCEIQWQKVTEFMKTRKLKSPDDKLAKKGILDEKRKLSITPEECPKGRGADLLHMTVSRKDKRKDSSPVPVWNLLQKGLGRGHEFLI